MKIGVVQTNPQNDFHKNLSQVKTLFENIASKNVDLIVLPEVFSFMGEQEERLKSAKKRFHKTMEFLKNAAQKHNVYLVCGSIDEPVEEVKIHDEDTKRPSVKKWIAQYLKQKTDKCFNTCFTISPTGHIISEYRKLHLFNLLDDNGQPMYCESDTYLSGDAPSSYPLDIGTEHWDALNIICYDLRFPEIVRYLGQPCDILFVPAAFKWETGSDHWEVLLRARAIENQCYVVATNQTGYYLNNQKRNYGNSMIIDPWGKVLAKLEEEEGILVCEILKSEVKKIRTKLPALNDRKIF